MGYTTEFTGQFKFNRPLTVAQYNTLKDLADGDHRDKPGVPGYYLQWVPTEDGNALEWDGNEKFYGYIEWLEYLIERHFKPWGITLDGRVRWAGEHSKDTGTILIKDNAITVKADKGKPTDSQRLQILRRVVNEIGSIATQELGRIGVSRFDEPGTDTISPNVLVGIKDIVDTALIDIGIADASEDNIDTEAN